MNSSDIVTIKRSDAYLSIKRQFIVTCTLIVTFGVANAMYYQSLKAIHRDIREGLPPNLSLRIHRALSWLNCAEQANDNDSKFIFLWISFNAAYAHEIENRWGKVVGCAK